MNELKSHINMDSSHKPEIEGRIFFTLNIFFYFSIAIDIQYYICFRHTTQ